MVAPALGFTLWAEWVMVLAGVDIFGFKQAMSHHE
ncbi:hypothetical protein DFAR_1180002 [Desulfarculales bacterium]